MAAFFCNINIDLSSQCKKAGTQHKAAAAIARSAINWPLR